MSQTRLSRLRILIRERNLDALLVTSLPNIRYLTGFAGSNALLLVLPRTAVFITDQRYRQQSREQVRGARRIIAKASLLEALKEHRLLRRGRVGFEAEHLPYASYRALRRLLPAVTLRPQHGLVEHVALRKDATELALLELAVRVTEQTFVQVLPKLRVGVRELDIAAEITYLHRRLGAEGDAFEPIVASGERGSLPHARPSVRKFRSGDMVTLDFGCTVGGYCADLTRTVAIGRASRRARQAYQAVRDAQEAAIAAMRPGMPAKELDRVARSQLARAGLGRYFSHSLGHGIGLRIHEGPRLAPRSRDFLETGNVVTIEPGVYLPGEFGIRIEDDLLVTEDGCRLLTSVPKELLVL
jgi:Xaa-Pro aminopeptidase